MSKIILIHEVTPELRQEVKEQFHTWIRSHQGYKDALDLDVWVGFKMSNGGFIDMHLIYDEKLELFIYPCDELYEEDHDGIVELTPTTSRSQYIVVKDHELDELLPKSFIEYVNEQANEVIL